MYIIPQRAKKSTNKIIKFDKKFTVSGVISIYLAYTIKNEVSNSRQGDQENVTSEHRHAGDGHSLRGAADEHPPDVLMTACRPAAAAFTSQIRHKRIRSLCT